jgi:hypothetical protein
MVGIPTGKMSSYAIPFLKGLDMKFVCYMTDEFGNTEDSVTVRLTREIPIVDIVIDPPQMILGKPTKVSCNITDEIPNPTYTITATNLDGEQIITNTNNSITIPSQKHLDEISITCDVVGYDDGLYSFNPVHSTTETFTVFDPYFDEDGDGIFDDENNNGIIDGNDDQCPYEKENINGYLDFDGCPDELPDTLPAKLNVVISRVNDVNNNTYDAVCKSKGEMTAFSLKAGYTDFNELYPSRPAFIDEPFFTSKDRTDNRTPEMTMKDDGTDIAVWCTAIDEQGGSITAIQYVSSFIDFESPPVGPPAPINPNNDDEPVKKKNNGGCGDCVPPTLGLGMDLKRIVNNGFSYNGNNVDVKKWYTPYPLINATVGNINTVDILVYENNGIYNMRMVQFGLGATHLGQPLHDLEVLIEIPLITDNTDDYIEVGDITIRDPENLIDNDSVTAHADVTECIDDIIIEECVSIQLHYSYREATINHMMVVSATDKPRNTQNFYFNHGVQVFGDSVNEPPTYTLHNRQTSQQTEDLFLTLTRMDKINHIWEDNYGIEYLKISEDRFDRITPLEPYRCDDPSLDIINVPTRNNCNFRALTSLWD